MTLLSALGYKLLVIVAVSFITLGVVHITSSNQGASERAYAVIDGKEFEISPGMVIARGNKNAEDSCNMPVMTIGGKTGKNATRGSIEVRINENCQAVVNSIKFDRNGPPVNDDHGGGNRVVPQPKKQLPEKGFRQSINSNGTAEASHLVTHHFKGWARSEMMDCCGIWLTRTHAEMQYYDDFHQV